MTPKSTSMKKIALLLSMLILVLCMTSCSIIADGFDAASDLIRDTIPNIIAKNTKDSFGYSDSSKETEKPSGNETKKAQTTQKKEQHEDVTPPPETSTVDYTELINSITTDTIHSCVNITTSQFYTQYSTSPSKSSYGSGIIFKAEVTSTYYHYYVITNYHVVDLSDNYSYYRYTITDYQGNEYKAITPQWLNDSKLKSLCEENDLAILEFETSTKLKVIEMGSKNPKIDQDIIAIGQPKGQHNAITLGHIDGYTEILLDNGFSPDYTVIAHTAPIDHGNSGGALLNTDLVLVGVNFAGAWNDDGTFSYGYGIPIETVLKFIESFDITL